jgi:hypothetical protein
LERLTENTKVRNFEESDHVSQTVNGSSGKTVVDLSAAYKKILDIRLLDVHDYLKMHENG